MKSKITFAVENVYISDNEDKRRENANRIIKQYINLKLKSAGGGDCHQMRDILPVKPRG